jgi:SAM-dependent methyltransferase
VVFFMPDPPRGIAEMARVTRAGGTVSSYVWDYLGGGFPYHPLNAAIAEIGHPPIPPPHPEAAELEALTTLWRDAGLMEVETRVITVERDYPDFDSYWQMATTAPVLAPILAALSPDMLAGVRRAVAARTGGGTGPLRFSARAHAVKGRR